MTGVSDSRVEKLAGRGVASWGEDRAPLPPAEFFTRTAEQMLREVSAAGLVVLDPADLERLARAMDPESWEGPEQYEEWQLASLDAAREVFARLEAL